MQQARAQGPAADHLSLLPSDDGGRLGLGQEPPDPDHPARRGLHVQRRDDRGAPRRGGRAGAHPRGARAEARRDPRRTKKSPSAQGAPPCSSPSTSATRRRSTGSTTASAWPSTGASPPRPSARETSSASSSEGSLELRDVGFEDIGGVCPAPRHRAGCACAPTPGGSRATTATLSSYSGRGRARGSRSPTTTRARWAGPNRQRGRGAERYGAPCIVVDFGTSTNFDIVSATGSTSAASSRRDRGLDGGGLRAPRGS